MKTAEESPTAIEVERALRSVESADDCKCGIPKCQGHEVVDGHAIFYGHPESPTHAAKIRL